MSPPHAVAAFALGTCCCLSAALTSAQRSSTGVISNVEWASGPSKVIVVTYDLDGPPGSEYIITLDGLATDLPVLHARHATGAIGDQVRPGRRLTISWNIQEDLLPLVADRQRVTLKDFKVQVQAASFGYLRIRSRFVTSNGKRAREPRGDRGSWIVREASSGAIVGELVDEKTSLLLRAGSVIIQRVAPMGWHDVTGPAHVEIAHGRTTELGWVTQEDSKTRRVSWVPIVLVAVLGILATLTASH